MTLLVAARSHRRLPCTRTTRTGDEYRICDRYTRRAAIEEEECRKLFAFLHRELVTVSNAASCSRCVFINFIAPTASFTRLLSSPSLLPLTLPCLSVLSLSNLSSIYHLLDAFIIQKRLRIFIPRSSLLQPHPNLSAIISHPS